MLQPKVYVKDKNKVYDTQVIDYKRKMVIFFDNDTQCTHARLFDEIEFMENTGYKDINKKHICVGDIVEILGVYFEIKYRTFKGYVIENKEYTLSLEANLDCVSIVGNIYENKDLLGVR
jgi:hypothetical protein